MGRSMIRTISAAVTAILLFVSGVTVGVAVAMVDNANNENTIRRELWQAAMDAQAARCERHPETQKELLTWITQPEVGPPWYRVYELPDVTRRYQMLIRQ